MEMLALHVKSIVAKDFPQVSRATKFEWWAHKRSFSDGHQLHFDSDDEGIGGVRNPICSTVLYISACGGGTLITNQTTKDKEIPQHAIICEPRENRLCCFHGDLLHCVVPGRGCCPDPGKKRITLMIAFWEELHVRDTGTMGNFTASMRYPDESSLAQCPAWTSLHSAGTLDAGDSECCSEVKLTTVGPVWKDLDARKNELSVSASQS